MIWAAGIDVGGTQLKAVAVDASGRVLARAVQPTEDGVATPADWIARARATLAEFATSVGSAATTVGVCAPGLAAADGRSIAHLPGKLGGLVGLDWTVALDRTDPVPVLNDGHAALLGEAWTGAARGLRHLVMLTLGTGIGGAVMSDGRLLRGAIGRAGHLGHLCLDPEGEPSITGMPGAIEVLAGDYTVPSRSRGRFADTAALVAAFQAGDTLATEVWAVRSVRASISSIRKSSCWAAALRGRATRCLRRSRGNSTGSSGGRADIACRSCPPNWASGPVASARPDWPCGRKQVEAMRIKGRS